MINNQAQIKNGEQKRNQINAEKNWKHGAINSTQNKYDKQIEAKSFIKFNEIDTKMNFQPTQKKVTFKSSILSSKLIERW